MITPKLITNYNPLSDSDLASLAARTADALRTNDNFPDLNPSFDDYEPLALDYIAKQAITSNGRASGQQKKEKDEAREALIIAMRAVTSYINNFTTVSSVQLSSGFSPVSDRKTTQSPRSSTWVRLVDSTRPAEILLQFEAVVEAYLYEMQIAWELDADGNPLWQDLPPTSRSTGNFYAPVEDGVIYYFRVRSRNRRGVSHWSPVAALRARVNA